MTEANRRPVQSYDSLQMAALRSNDLLAQFMVRETDMVGQLIRGGYTFKTYGRDEQACRIKSDINAATRMALVETGAEILRNPLFLYAPQFLTSRREMRIAELAGNLKRRGNAVIVGCGPLAEIDVLALRLKTMGKQDIKHFLEEDFETNIGEKMAVFQQAVEAGDIHILPQITQADLHPGDTLAFDPFLQPEAQNMLTSFRLPPSFFRSERWTLADYIDNQTQFKPSTLIMNRVDPRIVSAVYDRVITQADFEVILQDVVNTIQKATTNMSSGSTILISVGQGNDNDARHELSNRLHLLLTSRIATVHRPLFPIKFAEPTIIDGSNGLLRQALQNQWGISGFVVGKKR